MPGAPYWPARHRRRCHRLHPPAAAAQSPANRRRGERWSLTSAQALPTGAEAVRRSVAGRHRDGLDRRQVGPGQRLDVVRRQLHRGFLVPDAGHRRRHRGAGPQPGCSAGSPRCRAPAHCRGRSRSPGAETAARQRYWPAGRTQPGRPTPPAGGRHAGHRVEVNRVWG